MIPLLEAEADRDLDRRFEILKEREAKIMAKNHPEWSSMDLKAPVPGIGKWGKSDAHAAEPVYHTDMYVQPTFVFAPPAHKNVIEAQWWRGSTVLTKVCDRSHLVESGIPGS